MSQGPEGCWAAVECCTGDDDSVVKGEATVSVGANCGGLGFGFMFDCSWGPTLTMLGFFSSCVGDCGSGRIWEPIGALWPPRMSSPDTAGGNGLLWLCWCAGFLKLLLFAGEWDGKSGRLSSGLWRFKMGFCRCGFGCRSFTPGGKFAGILFGCLFFCGKWTRLCSASRVP